MTPIPYVAAIVISAMWGAWYFDIPDDAPPPIPQAEIKFEHCSQVIMAPSQGGAVTDHFIPVEVVKYVPVPRKAAHGG